MVHALEKIAIDPTICHIARRGMTMPPASISLHLPRSVDDADPFVPIVGASIGAPHTVVIDVSQLYSSCTAGAVHTGHF